MPRKSPQIQLLGRQSALAPVLVSGNLLTRERSVFPERRSGFSKHHAASLKDYAAEETVSSAKQMTLMPLPKVARAISTRC